MYNVHRASLPSTPLYYIEKGSHCWGLIRKFRILHSMWRHQDVDYSLINGHAILHTLSVISLMSGRFLRQSTLMSLHLTSTAWLGYGHILPTARWPSLSLTEDSSLPLVCRAVYRCAAVTVVPPVHEPPPSTSGEGPPSSPSASRPSRHPDYDMAHVHVTGLELSPGEAHAWRRTAISARVSTLRAFN